MTESRDTASCDLCGWDGFKPLLESPRLDGPLVACGRCGLVYVKQAHKSFVFEETDWGRTQALAERVSHLDVVRHDVEEAERPLRIAADRDRLDRVRRHVGEGTLLDVGCSTGGFLKIARDYFDVYGVEVDPGTSALARDAGLAVTTGTVWDVIAPAGAFDVVTYVHVIEHLESPHRELLRVRELVHPGSVVMIETPTVDTWWFKVMRQRWRQLLPDHYYFYSRRTLEKLLADCGLEPIEYRKVGRRVSLRFLADRARRAGIPMSRSVQSLLARADLQDRTVYVNPGDIMSVVSRAY